MSPREQRLRERIDILLEEREELRRIRKRNKGTRKHCVYCGAVTRTVRRVATCPPHRDLVEVDPLYA